MKTLPLPLPTSQDAPANRLALQIAAYLAAALLAALMLGVLLESEWTLPMDAVAAANFTA